MGQANVAEASPTPLKTWKDRTGFSRNFQASVGQCADTSEEV
jgi:hypothetical protein